MHGPIRPAHLVQADLARLQEVIQATRGGNDDLDAVVDVTQLGALGRATINTAAGREQRSGSTSGSRRGKE